MSSASVPSQLRGLVGTLRAEGFDQDVEVVDHRPPRRGHGRHAMLLRALENNAARVDSMLDSISETSEISTLPTELELELRAHGWTGRFEVSMRAEPKGDVLCFAAVATELASGPIPDTPPLAMATDASTRGTVVEELRRALDRDLWGEQGRAWADLSAWLAASDLPAAADLHAMMAVRVRGLTATGLRSDDLVGEFLAARRRVHVALPRAMKIRRYGLGGSPWAMSAEWFGPFVVRLAVGGGPGQGAYSPLAFDTLLDALGPCGLLLSPARCLRIEAGMVLAGRPLEMIALPNFDLRGTDGRDARFRRATLRRTWFDGVDLRGADFCRADMTSVCLADARLDGAIFRRANLEGADLSEARLEGADLRGAKLARAELQGARLTDADLRGADLRGASISGDQLRSARVEGDWWDSQVEEEDDDG